MINDYNFIVQDEPIPITMDDQLRETTGNNGNSRLPSIVVASILSTSGTINTNTKRPLRSDFPIAEATTSSSPNSGIVTRTADIAYPIIEAVDIESRGSNDPRRRVRNYPSQRQILVFKWVFILTFVALAIVIAITSVIGATSTG